MCILQNDNVHTVEMVKYLKNYCKIQQFTDNYYDLRHGKYLTG